MGIKRNSLPGGLARAIASELGAQAAAHEDAAPFGDTAGGADNPVDAIPIYGVDEARLRDDPKAALENARRIGWRTVTADVEDDAGGFALVDSYRSRGEADQVRVIRGPTVSGFAAAGTLAEAELDGEEAEFEPRILDFGTLGLTALWMHSPTATDRCWSLGTDRPELGDTASLLAEARRRADLQPRRGGDGGGTGTRRTASPTTAAAEGAR